jgi:hypothetical protein
VSYADAVNSFAYKRAATQPHFRPSPGPLRGPVATTIRAGFVERLKSGDLLVHEPFGIETRQDIIDTPTLGSDHPGGAGDGWLNHDIDYTAPATLVGTILDGFGGSDVTPPEPDEPAVEVTVKCGTCGETVGFVVSVTEAIAGVLESGR